MSTCPGYMNVIAREAGHYNEKHKLGNLNSGEIGFEGSEALLVL